MSRYWEAWGSGCVALGQAFLRGVRTGPRAALDLSPGVRRIFVGASPSPVEVTLPANWIAVAEPGPDFDLAWLQAVVDVDQPRRSLGIYLGHHPRPHGGDRALAGVPGRLFGEPMTWNVWHIDAGAEGPARTQMEFLRTFPGHPGLVVHVFFSANTPRQLTELRRIAETLQTR